MPDNTQYTRCPECSTAFKVSDKMLSMAKGKVRCGACLVVFQATDFILKAKSKTPIAPVTPVTPVEPIDPSSSELTEESSNNQLEPTQSALDFNESENNESTQVSENLSPPNEPVSPQSDISEDFNNPIETDTLEEPEIQRQENSRKSTDEVERFNEDELPAFNPSTAITEGSLPIISADGKVINEAFIEESDESFEPDSFKNDHFEAGDFPAEKIDPESFYIETNEPESPEREELAPENQQIDELDPEINFDDPEDGVPVDMEPNINIDSDLDDFVLEDFEPIESNSFDEDIQEYIPTEIESLSDDEQVIENIQLDENEFIDEAIDEDSHNIDEMLDIDIIDEKLDDMTFSSTDELTESESSEPLIETSDDELSTDEDDDFEKLADTLATQINDADTDPDPLDEFEERVEKKKTSLRTGVIIAVILIILSVLSVKFWSNRQTLSWDKTWGPVTTSICTVLPCDLKARRDVAKIRLRQKVVMPLEYNENRLSIKLMFTNEASFEQPYPTISITFSSPQGESIAIKRFSVNDYFPEKQNQLMPTDAEIHISFETDLPHPNALGFEFNFE